MNKKTETRCKSALARLIKRLETYEKFTVLVFEDDNKKDYLIKLTRNEIGILEEKLGVKKSF